jgi:hypothetical protein
VSWAQVEARWRQIDGERYSTAGDRFNPPGLDCSGAIIYANRGLIPGLPTVSATVAQWAIRNRLTKPLSRRAPGDLTVWDRYGVPSEGFGNRGHIGQVSSDVNTTWEAASSNGVRRYRLSRLGWQMCVDTGRWLRAGGLPGPIEEEDDLREDERKWLAEIHSMLAQPSKAGTPRSLLLDIRERLGEVHAGIYDGSKPTIMRTIAQGLDRVWAKLNG